MKLMNVSHIAIIPYITCNFLCSYCCANKYGNDSLKLWKEKEDDIIKFLNILDKKMILVSGGEPLLYDWSKIIEKTNHYWYFATNTSVVPKFLYNSNIKEKIKLFISAFHREQTSIDKFVNNVLELQDIGYSVFCKMIYVKDDKQLKEWELVNNSNIPVSFVPLLGAKYSKEELSKVLPYCTSTMYKNRFLNLNRKPSNCIAGTNETFEIRGTSIVRCGLQDIPLLDNVTLPDFIKKILHDEISNNTVKTLCKVSNRINPFLGSIYNPRFYQESKMCYRRKCECEWHTFSGIGDDSENSKWQQLIDTGKWL